MATLIRARVSPLLLGAICIATVVGHDDHCGIGELGGVRVEPCHNKTVLHNVTAKGGNADAGAEMAKHVMFPAVALFVGAILMGASKVMYDSFSSVLGDVGKMVLYFGAQTGMNLYMKAVLSSSTVSQELDLHGCPAGFAITAVQQITAFALFGTWIIFSQLTGCPYQPKKLTSKMEWFAVVCFSLSFTMNIALNNYSLSLIPISSNLIIRSCLPLSTFFSSMAIAKLTGEPIKDFKVIEVVLMICGVVCAAVVCYAEHQGDEASKGSSYVFGCIVCLVSLLSGSMNLALAGMLGTTVHLNALDTTVYMSVPATIFLIGPVFLYSHPIKDQAWIDYMGDDTVTDWSVFEAVCKLSPTTIVLAVFSGALALAYNVLQYGIVQSLSAAHTAFAGNFNKAATIVLSILVGLETVPEGTWGIVMMLAVFGNISSFTAYNVVKVKAKEQEHEPLSDDEDHYDSDDGFKSS